MLAALLLVYLARFEGETRNYADGTNSSEFELRRRVRNDRAFARSRWLPFVVKRYRRQSIHVA
jgi:hypothetical protein